MHENHVGRIDHAQHVGVHRSLNARRHERNANQATDGPKENREPLSRVCRPTILLFNPGALSISTLVPSLVQRVGRGKDTESVGNLGTLSLTPNPRNPGSAATDPSSRTLRRRTSMGFLSRYSLARGIFVLRVLAFKKCDQMTGLPTVSG